MRGLAKIFHNYKRKIVSFEGEPEFIAKGFALGSFIGMLPIPGFHILSSMALAFLLKLNKKSVFLGVIKTNLFTAGLIFSFNYWLGKKLLGLHSDFRIPAEIDFEFFRILLESGIDVFLCLLAGGILMGIVSALVTYYLVLIGIKNYRNHAVR
ncbi:MAG TPA: DUF2062 domain-containing protein [Moheibacter sp.]|nr:DUF2062 domain-containing protein [Moheibacter sp.]